MPAPVIGPCGQPGQPACPPTPAIQVNPGDVIEYKGKKFVVHEDQGENNDSEDQN